MSIYVCNISHTQSSQIVYNKIMKKTLFTSLKTAMLAFVLMSAPAFAQELPANTVKADTAVTPKESTPETKPLVKSDPLTLKRQKIEADLRATIVKLGLVIERTQTLIDLLNKNGRDTIEASRFLFDARTSLQNAVETLDQFSGVIIPIPEVKVETKILRVSEKVVPTIIKITPAPASLKDLLKKTEDSLKESKSYIIASIGALKESLATKVSE